MMTERINRLQSLLERIKRNAALPRRSYAPPMVAVTSRVPTTVEAARAKRHVPTQMGIPPASDERIEELDLDEAGVLENPTNRPPAVAALEEEAFDLQEKTPIQSAHVSTSSDIDNLSWSEPPAEESPPPDSSRRPRVASSMDEALAEATPDSESQIPIKTPPPESGRQPTEGMYTAAMPDVAGDTAAVPTAEQLGETLELEAPTAAEIELDVVHAKVSQAKEELEVEFPPQSSVLEPPCTAESDVPRRAPEQSQILAMQNEANAADLVAVDSMPPDDTMLSNNAELLALQPDVTRRVATAQQATIDLLHAARVFAPQSFLELLDASLQLGRD